jgi:hypothetical protein
MYLAECLPHIIHYEELGNVSVEALKSARKILFDATFLIYIGKSPKERNLIRRPFQ